MLDDIKIFLKFLENQLWTKNFRMLYSTLEIVLKTVFKIADEKRRYHLYNVENHIESRIAYDSIPLFNIGMGEICFFYFQNFRTSLDFGQ